MRKKAVESLIQVILLPMTLIANKATYIIGHQSNWRHLSYHIGIELVFLSLQGCKFIFLGHLGKPLCTKTDVFFKHYSNGC